jgi:hypothetical protein
MKKEYFVSRGHLLGFMSGSANLDGHQVLVEVEVPVEPLWEIKGVIVS